MQNEECSMQHLIIRPMRLEDADAKGYVHWRSCLETYQDLLEPAYFEKSPLSVYQDIARRYPENTFVAEVDGRIAGFGTWKDTGEVYGLYVLKAYQGFGIGRLLLEAMLERLSGCPEIWLMVLDGNDQAIGFYEHMGFRLDGHREKNKYSAAHPSLRMVRTV